MEPKLSLPQQVSWSGADGPVGALYMVLSTVLLLITFAARIIIETFVLGIGPWTAQSAVSVAVFWALILGCVMLFATGVAIRRSRRWGFCVALTLNGLLILFGQGVGLLGLARAVFCTLRLIHWHD